MITIDQEYVELPGVASAAHVPAKGMALDAAWAQTVARNTNYMAARARAPVIMSGFYWFDDDATLKLGLPRGRAPLLRPHNALRVIFRAHYVYAAGEVVIWAGRRPWKAATPNADDVSSSVPIANASHQTFEVHLGVVPVARDRMVYVYFQTKSVVIESWVVLAEVLDV